MKDTMKNSAVLLALLAIGATGAGNAFANGGSAVGNGGDVMTRYLQATRDALKATVARLQMPNQAGALCADQNSLSQEQVGECRAFIIENIGALLRLVSSQSKVGLLLRDDPLLVEGADGKARSVDARTPLGESGDIEFYYPSVRNYSPMQLATLMAHEFGHKVLYRGSYVEDNAAIGSFASGRALLDSVAFALASYGQRERLIGGTFSLNDRFLCQVDTSYGPPLWVSGTSPRVFLGRASFDEFQTAIGHRPADMVLYVDEYGRSQLHFRAFFSEKNGCRVGAQDGRGTVLQLVRVFLLEPNGAQRPDEVLLSEERAGWNPLCEKDGEAFRLQYGRLRFECRYDGALGFVGP